MAKKRKLSLKEKIAKFGKNSKPLSKYALKVAKRRKAEKKASK